MKSKLLLISFFLVIVIYHKPVNAENRTGNVNAKKTKTEASAPPADSDRKIEAPPAEPESSKSDLSAERIDPLSKYFLTGQFVIGTPGFSLELENQNQTKKVSYAPNLKGTVGIGISFKDLIGATASLHGSPSADSYTKGSTDYDDFHFVFDFKNFFIEAQYQRYNGLYVSNSTEVDPTAAGNILAPNISMQNILLEFTYVFRPQKFSIQAAISRTERQIHSGGSWLIGAKATQTTLENATGLIPTQIRSYYGADQDLTKDRSRTLMLTGGYAYTISFSEKFFSTLLGVVGYGWGDSSFASATSTSSLTYGASTVGLKFVLAYNGDSLIAGISSENDSTLSLTNTVRINSNPTLSQLFVGTRY